MAGKKKAAVASKARKPKQRDAVSKENYASIDPLLPVLDRIQGRGVKPAIFPIPLKVKKLGKKADMSEFRAQLDSIGVKIVEVTADGNCFFRFRTLFLSWILVNNFFISRKEGGCQ